MAHESTAGTEKRLFGSGGQVTKTVCLARLQLNVDDMLVREVLRSASGLTASVGSGVECLYKVTAGFCFTVENSMALKSTSESFKKQKTINDTRGALCRTPHHHQHLN